VVLFCFLGNSAMLDQDEKAPPVEKKEIVAVKGDILKSQTSISFTDNNQG